MEITMKEAILQGKDFEFDTMGFKLNDNKTILLKIKPCLYEMSTKWILENQDKLVEVEDNYWDEDGRAIRWLKEEVEYFYINYTNDKIMKCNFNISISSCYCFYYNGNMFKDKESAEAELERLKQKQKERMGK